MESLFLTIVLAHIIGDFFLQHSRMANNKNKSGWKAHFWCSVHVIVYTLCISIFAGNYSPLFFLGVFIPHWIVDRWSFAYHWMKVTDSAKLLRSNNPTEAAFGVAIYITMDQTFHIVSLYVLLRLM